MELYTFGNLHNLTFELLKPLHNSQRIKYSSYDISNNYIICGATSGSLYLFHRQPCNFLQLIPKLNGPINYVAISPKEHYIAFSTQSNIHIYVIDLKAIQPVIFSSYYHEMIITQIRWKKNENQLFLGDIKGNVFLVNLNCFLGRINISIHPILFLESPIVQICEFEHLLLVSNFSKTILCNTETEEFKQIGNQPRDGKFGACFFLNSISRKNKSLISKNRIICARPGARIWECNIDGNVLQTHKFKKNLENENATQLFDPNGDILLGSEYTDIPKHNLSELLVNLQIVNESFVLAHTQNAFYIFDLVHSKIISWNNSFGTIHTIKVVSNVMILFTEDQKAYSFQMFKLDDMFAKLVASELYLDGAKIIKEHLNYFLNKLSSASFCQNYEKLRKQLISSSFLKPFNEFLKNFDAIFLKICDEKYEDKHKQNPGPKSQNPEHCFEIISNETSLNMHKPKETNILNDLFIIYKSLKISNYDMRERHGMIFDGYDLPDIKRLLKTLEQIITDNDSNTSTNEAKETCACIYLNYVVPNIFKQLPAEFENYAVDCFLLINSSIKSLNVQRCEFCNFPLSGKIAHYKYENVGVLLIKRLINLNESERLFDLISRIPTLLNVLLKVIANECPLDRFADIFFACSHETFLKQNKLDLLTSDFWSLFFSRLKRLHNDKSITCIRCSKISKINIKTLIEFEKQYTYDCAFNNCLTVLDGNSALELCKLFNLPADAIGKVFYLKCLLNGNTFEKVQTNVHQIL